MRRWIAAAICSVALFFTIPVGRVAAHAAFISSDPVQGSVLAVAPKMAELRFSEPVLLSASSVRLLYLGSSQEDDLELSTAHGGTTVLATMPPSESGEQVDSSWLSITLTIVADAALLAAVGAVVLSVLVVRRRRSELTEIGSVATIASVVLEAAWIGLLLADAATVGFENVRWSSLILSSDPGRRALVGLGMTIGVTSVVPMLRAATELAARWFVVRILAVITAGYIAAAAFGGHAGIGGSFAVGAVLRFLHLASLGLWIGLVASLWVVTRRRVELRTLWPDVGTLATVGLGLTGATGLLLSGRVAVTITALLGTTYGQRIVRQGRAAAGARRAGSHRVTASAPR